jgi:hypothetical protein
MMVLLWVSVILVWVLLLAIAFALLALYRHFGQMYMSLPQQKAMQGPKIGAPLASLALTDTRGRTTSVPSGRPTALIFASTTCTFCTEIREALAAPHSTLKGTDFVVLCSGPKKDVEAWAARTSEAVHVVWDSKSELIDKFEINGTPFGVAVGQDSQVNAKGIVNGLEGLEWVASQARSSQLAVVGEETATS